MFICAWQMLLKNRKTHATSCLEFLLILLSCVVSPWSSCQCGPQNTVVYSCIGHFGRVEIQRHNLDVFVMFHGESRDSRAGSAALYHRFQKLWCCSNILPVPPKTVTGTGVIAGQMDGATLSCTISLLTSAYHVL